MNTWSFMRAFVDTIRDEKKGSWSPINHIYSLKAMGVQKGMGLTSHEHDNMIVRNDQELNLSYIFWLELPHNV